MHNLSGSICLFLLVLLLSIASAQFDDQLFKINKLNQIYAKAQNSLGPSKLKELKKELSRHEPDELSLKERKAHHRDKDGLFEASVRRNLLTILRKYSLDHFFDHVYLAPSESAKSDQNNSEESLINNQEAHVLFKGKPNFRDKKLDKLWKKAEQAGFSDEELMLLHEEFQHQQEKIDEHYNAMNLMEQKLNSQAISEAPESSANSLESVDDDLEQQKKESSEAKKARLDHNIHQDLKEKYSDIKNNIDLLTKKVATVSVDGPERPFEEPIVNDLWSAAKEAKFDDNELDSLREELEHYEVRIKKLKRFSNELERDKLASKPKSQGPDDEREGFKRLIKRVKDLTRKIEKTHKSIEKKIVTRRIEL